MCAWSFEENFESPWDSNYFELFNFKWGLNSVNLTTVFYAAWTAFQGRRRHVHTTQWMRPMRRPLTTPCSSVSRQQNRSQRVMWDFSKLCLAYSLAPCHFVSNITWTFSFYHKVQQITFRVPPSNSTVWRRNRIGAAYGISHFRVSWGVDSGSVWRIWTSKSVHLVQFCTQFDRLMALIVPVGLQYHPSSCNIIFQSCHLQII